MRIAEAETDLRAGLPLRAAAGYRGVAARSRGPTSGGAEEVEALAGLGRALLDAGRPAAAAAPLRQAIRQVRAGGAQDILPALLTTLSEAELRSGAVVPALGHAREALRAGEATGDLRARAGARAAARRRARRRGRPPGGLRRAAPVRRPP